MTCASFLHLPIDVNLNVSTSDGKHTNLNSPAVVVVVASCVVVVVTCSVVVDVGSRIDYCKFDHEQLSINA